MSCSKELCELLLMPDKVAGADQKENILSNSDEFFDSWQGLALDSRLILIRSLFTEQDDLMIPLVEKLYEFDRDKKVRATIISCLGYWNEPQVFHILKQALASGDSRIRANAVEALSKSDSEEAYFLILPRINDSDNRVRANAVRAVWKRDKKSSLAKLRDMLISGDVWHRASAAYVLRFINDPFFIPYLADLLKDPFETVVEKAMTALQQYKDDCIVNPVIRLVENQDTPLYIMLKAVSLLGKNIDSKMALEKLLFLAESDSESVASAAVSELGNHKSEGVVNFLVHRAADRSAPLSIRKSAVNSLNGCTFISAINVLLSITASSEEPDMLRSASSKALSELSGRVNEIELSGYITDENYKYFNTIMDISDGLKILLIIFINFIVFFGGTFSCLFARGIWQGPRMNFPFNRYKVLNSSCFRITFTDFIGIKKAEYAADYLNRAIEKSGLECFLSKSNRIDIKLQGHDNYLFFDSFNRTVKGCVDVYDYSAPYENINFPVERNLVKIAGYHYFKNRLKSNVSPVMRALTNVFLPFWLVRGSAVLLAFKGNWVFEYSLNNPDQSDRNIDFHDLSIKDKNTGPWSHDLVMESARFVNHLVSLKGREKFSNFIFEFNKSPHDIEKIFVKYFNSSMNRCYDKWKRAFYKKKDPAFGEWKNQFKIIDIYDKPVFSPVHTADEMIFFTTPAENTDHAYNLMIKDSRGVRKIVDMVGRKIASCKLDDSYILYIIKMNEADNGTIYEDLFKYDVTTGRLKRVTKKKHLLEPSVSENGKKIIAVSKGVFTSSIVKVEETGEIKELTSNSSGVYDFSPALSPEGGNIVFIRYREMDKMSGNLMMLDENNQIISLSNDNKARFQPLWTGEQRFVFLEENEQDLMLLELSVNRKNLKRSIKNMLTCNNFTISGLNYNNKGIFCTLKDPGGYCLGLIETE